MDSFVCDFEKKVLSSLQSLLVEAGNGVESVKSIGVAVSGGADSIALYTALCRSLPQVKIHAFTINHNIRSARESGGDADFVQQYAAGLKNQGFDTECTRLDFPSGSVRASAALRCRGIEEAARSMRYEAFDNFLKQNNIPFMCLAHNQNDNLETLLMRFLQGSGIASGIRGRRGKYLRPLLEISRAEIEKYLTLLNVSWRTDSTNSDTNYFRNKIRLELVPYLDGFYKGWRRGVLCGAEKARYDQELIEEKKSDLEWTECEGGVFISAQKFFGGKAGLRIRAVYRAFSMLGEEERIPFDVVKRIVAPPDISMPHVCDVVHASSMAQNVHLQFNKFTWTGYNFYVEGENLFIKKNENVATESGFFVIIEEEGKYQVPGKNGPGVVEIKGLGNIEFPCVLRSRADGDFVLTKDGGTKSVNRILSDFKVPAELKDFVPVVQEIGSGKIVAVLAGFLGYKDWIVK